MNRLINSHCHLGGIADLDAFLQSRNDVFISNALDDAELDKHLSVNRDNLLITTGQHPLYPKDSITIDRLIELLKENKLFGIGEIGLDKRNPDFEQQKYAFLEHCDIAKQYDKPIIIHCVGYYYELLGLIKKSFPKQRYILHGFQGSVDIVKAFSKYDVIFSLHKDILKVKNVIGILNEIFDNHRFVFETDMDKEEGHDVSKTMQEIESFSNKAGLQAISLNMARYTITKTPLIFL